MNNRELTVKVHSSMYHQCQKRGYATPVDVLIELGYLSKQDYENWRFGRIPYLERVCKVNLSKLSFVLYQMRVYAQKTGLKPSFCFYKRWGVKKKNGQGHKPVIPLRLSSPLPITNEQVQAALDKAVEQVRLNLPKYTKRCQNHSSVDNIYPACCNTQWTCGFWPGEVWLAYERTKDDAFRQTGKTMVESFHRRIVKKIRVAHHDMGFLYTPACVAAYKLTGDQQAREAAILAADQLISRFQPNGEFIQAWGRMGAKMNYRFIIDCLLNLPLLYWASQETGDLKYADIANRHTATCMANSFRPDGSTFHTFYMNKDGTPGYGRTCQGYRDDSFWARGQAWGVYGSILSYRYTGDPAALDTFKRALAFYLTRLPEDLVPCWDMLFQPDSGEPRDSSSTAIVACGLLEAVRILPKEESGEYEKLAREMIGSLAANYAVSEPKVGTGLILHGTYSKKSPYNTCFPEGVDECTSWGDFFYMEALTRLSGDWNPYW